MSTQGVLKLLVLSYSYFHMQNLNSGNYKSEFDLSLICCYKQAGEGIESCYRCRVSQISAANQIAPVP